MGRTLLIQLAYISISVEWRREGQSRGRRDKLEARGKIAKEPQFLWDLFYIPLIIFGRMGSGSTIITSTQLLSLGGKSFIGLVIITP